MNPTLLNFIANHTLDFIVITVGAFYGYGQLRNKRDIDSLNDDSKWQAALNIRNVEITDLKAQILEQQTKHATELMSLQTQITALQLEVKTLSGKNDVLIESISGNTLFMGIVEEQKKISESLIKFEVLLSTDGLLCKFMDNDVKIITGIEDIKAVLNIAKRTADA